MAVIETQGLFHYLQPDLVLREGMQVFDTTLLLLVGAGAVVYALIVFPRRDLGAPA